MENKNLEERIDKFLNGAKDESLLNEIQSSIDNDPELKQDLGEHVIANILLKREGEQSLKAKLTQQLQSHDLAPQTKNHRSWIMWMVLVVVLGIIAVLSILILPNNNNTIQSQFAYEDPSVPNVRSLGEGQQMDSWKKAMSSLEEKEYVKALQYLNQIEPSSSFIQKHGDNYKLVKGVCSMRLDNFEEAIEILESIPTISPYYDQALWYQFLCAYKGKNVVKASQIFDEIEAYQNHFRVEQAEQLFNTLRE